jgi:pimeloyl-ACP methyl ester carboxylesterase
MAIADALQRAATRAGAAVDRGVLRYMERKMRASGPPRPPRDARQRLLRIAEHYRGQHDRFFAAPATAELEVRRPEARAGAREVLDLAFPSTWRPRHPGYLDEYAGYGANLTARARWYRGGGARPVIVCLHGWGGGAFWLEERAFLVPYLLRIGLDPLLFQLPFHGDRSPAQAPRSGALFPSAHVIRTNEAFGQALHDLRALSAWLRDRDVPAIGVAGMSLGGYTGALWASVDPELAFAVPMIPAVSMSELMWRHGAGSPARRRAEKAGVDQRLLDEAFAIHAPLSRPVALPRDRLLIVAGRGDRITPPDQARALWQHWGRPALHWFPGGHLAQIGRGDAFRALRRHLQGLGLIPPSSR